jgi:hypothetical protein
MGHGSLTNGWVTRSLMCCGVLCCVLMQDIEPGRCLRGPALCVCQHSLHIAWCELDKHRFGYCAVLGCVMFLCRTMSLVGVYWLNAVYVCQHSVRTLHGLNLTTLFG